MCDFGIDLREGKKYQATKQGPKQAGGSKPSPSKLIRRPPTAYPPTHYLGPNPGCPHSAPTAFPTQHLSFKSGFLKPFRPVLPYPYPPYLSFKSGFLKEIVTTF
jgi:hypothetical protein